MPKEVDIPISGPAYRNIEETSVPSAASVLVMDAYINEFGQTERRPGLSTYADLGTGSGIDGLFWWDEASKVIAVSNGRIFSIVDTSPPTVTDVTGDALRIGTPVTVASGGSGSLILANGGRMVRYLNVGTTAYIADADAPTEVSHVAYLDGYILALKSGTGQFMFSNLNDPTNWLLSSVATAEGNPDILVAMGVFQRELYLWGRNTLEIWYNDGTTPFSRLPGVYIERGCSAPYSIVPAVSSIANAWFWIDQDRRFVRLNNRSVEAVSVPFDRQLANLSTVADCRGFLMQAGTEPLYVLTCPTDQRTFVYNLLRNDWSEWGYWDAVSAVYRQYRGQAACYARAWNKHLVGDHTNGLIYTASRSVFQDAGNPMRTFRRTAEFDYDTYERKRSQQAIYHCQRGLGTDTTAPQFFVRKNKDGKGWGNEQFYSLGAVGDYRHFVRTRGHGVYRTLQLEIGCTDNCDFILVGGKELVEPLV